MSISKFKLKSKSYKRLSSDGTGLPSAQIPVIFGGGGGGLYSGHLKSTVPFCLHCTQKHTFTESFQVPASKDEATRGGKSGMFTAISSLSLFSGEQHSESSDLSEQGIDLPRLSPVNYITAYSLDLTISGSEIYGTVLDVTSPQTGPDSSPFSLSLLPPQVILNRPIPMLSTIALCC